MGTNKHKQTNRHTTPTRGRIIVADGIYSVGDKKPVAGFTIIEAGDRFLAELYPSLAAKASLLLVERLAKPKRARSMSM